MRVIRCLILVVGATAMVGAVLAALDFFSQPATLTPGSALAAPLSQTTFSLTLSGPDTASLNEVVTYTVSFTVPASPGTIWGIQYLHPTAFTVSSTDPVTTSVPYTGVLQWTADGLAGYSHITITGQHGVGGCSPVTHTARFYDIYGWDLPSTGMSTTITDLHCTYLPAALRYSQ